MFYITFTISQIRSKLKENWELSLACLPKHKSPLINLKHDVQTGEYPNKVTRLMMFVPGCAPDFLLLSWKLCSEHRFPTPFCSHLYCLTFTTPPYFYLLYFCRDLLFWLGNCWGPSNRTVSGSVCLLACPWVTPLRVSKYLLVFRGMWGNHQFGEIVVRALQPVLNDRPVWGVSAPLTRLHHFHGCSGIFASLFFHYVSFSFLR